MDKYECPCSYVYDPAVGDPDNGMFNDRNRWMTEVVEDYGLTKYGNR